MTTALFYFFYFAAFGMYIPYWTLYLQHLQLSSLEIATVYSLRSVAFVFFPAVYGYLADRWQIRKSFLLLTAIGQIVPMLLILYLHSYLWLLILTALFSLSNAAVLPLAEAIAQEEHDQGRLDYGRTRLWGTLSFILLAVCFGKLLDHVAQEWILYGFIVFLCLLACITVAMPNRKTKIRLQRGHLQGLMTRKSIWVLFLCIFLMQTSHGSFYGFYSIYLAGLGFKNSSIGLQWAISATSEIAVLFFASRILRTFSTQTLFRTSLLIAVVRWTLTYFADSLSTLSAIQCLHAFTFGLFHVSSLRLIQRMFPEQFRTFGQALYTMATAGLGSAVGVLLNGYLWDKYHAETFLISAAIALVAFALSFLNHKDTK